MSEFPEMDIKPDFNKAGSGDLLDPPAEQPAKEAATPQSPGATPPSEKKEAEPASSPKTPQVDVYREMQAKLDRERSAREKAELEREKLAKKLEGVDNLSEIENKLEEVKRKEADFAAKETRNKMILDEFPQLRGNEDLVPLSDIESMRSTASRLSGLTGNTPTPLAPSFAASSGGHEPISKKLEGVSSYEEARVKLNELSEEEFNRLSQEMGYNQGNEATLSDYEKNLRQNKK